MNNRERRALRRSKERDIRSVIVKNALKENTPSSTVQKESENKPHKALLAIVLAICTLLGGLVAILALLPRPIVSSPSVPFDPENVLSVSFDISNANFVPLQDVSVFFGLGQVVTGRGGHLRDFVPDGYARITNPEWLHHNLGMDEKFTINVGSMFGGASAADMEIVVSYKPWLLPIRKEKVFRFVTTPRSDGQMYWRSWPVGERLPKF